MQSKAKDVESYLKDVPVERLESLHKIRQLCLHELKGYKESMLYGMPCYEKNNIVEVAFASQKNFIALYILKQEVLEASRDLLKGISVGKGCIRYTRPAKIDFEVIKNMLMTTYVSTDAICG